jgi:hypothetical protein
MGGLNLMDPSAERVVYEKSANQPQPQLPSSTDRLQRKKKQLDNNITPSQIDSNVLSSTVKN